jgi:hypothetical protein
MSACLALRWFRRLPFPYLPGTALIKPFNTGTSDDRSNGPSSDFGPQSLHFDNTLREDPVMKQRINTRFANCLLAIGLAALAPVAAQAQAVNDKWQWELGVYGWFPAIGASTAFPSGAGGPTIEVSADDVIDSLKMTFMGQIEARKGRWGFWTDVVYADLGGTEDSSRNFTVAGRPVSTAANLGLDVKSTAWTLAGIYNLTSTPQNTTDLLFGARMLDLEQRLNWTLASSIPELPGRTGEAKEEATNWDAIVGLKGRYFLGAERKWFLPYYVDVGGGDSSLTWQINAGVGYKFDWGSMFATWRYLDYDFKSGTALQSMDMNGAVIGALFQF